jgi:hypothetical protein
MSQTYSSNDFNDIMDSLVLFMRNQDEFKDMNFDGSAIRELLRVLSFNAQQQAFQNNFVFNELQLDTAQLRKNVASIASRLGYLPSSMTAAKIHVNLSVTPVDLDAAPASLVLDRNAQFYATRDGQTYIFSPDQAYTGTMVGGKFVFNNVTLLQGIWNINGYLVEDAYGFPSYVIPNEDVDISTLEVAVRASESSGTQELYTQFKTAYDLADFAKLFFVRENRDGLYEFKFGDNKFAKRLDLNNVITARYLVTRGSEGNNLSNLSPVSSIGGYYDIELTALDERSYGGADQEDIESIRTLAPVTFAASGNAVTPGDYVALSKKLYSGVVQDAICWGGEENTPPRFGYVFLSVIPKSSEVLTDPQKIELTTILKKYNVGSVTPIIVNPTHTYINVETTVKYKVGSLSITTVDLQNKIESYLRAFSKNKMERFSGHLEMSEFSEYIDRIDPSIQGNYTQVSYERRFVPTLNTASSYAIPFSHSLKAGTIQITGFKVADGDGTGYTYSMYDDAGVLKLQKSNGIATVQMNSNMGTVDYENGIVRVDNFKPSVLVGDYLKVTASAENDQSLIAVRNSILKINNIVSHLQAVIK